jgi:electron transport complex protein RnfG
LGAKSTAPEFFGQYENIDALSLSVVKSAPSAPEQIQAISGATITSNAVTLGVNTALDYWRKNIAEGYASADETDSISGASEIGGE